MIGVVKVRGLLTVATWRSPRPSGAALSCDTVLREVRVTKPIRNLLDYFTGISLWQVR